jgi:hypothetical protein
MSGWVDLRIGCCQPMVRSLLCLLLLGLVAAAPVGGECPSLDSVAKGWGSDENLRFPPMLEGSCDRDTAQAEVEKLVRAVEERLGECIKTPGSEDCSLSAKHLEQLAETLLKGNQQTAYRKLCDLLREIYPQVGLLGKARVEDASKALEPLITRMTTTIPVSSRDVDKLRRDLVELTGRVGRLESRKTPEQVPSTNPSPRPRFGPAITLVVFILGLAAGGAWWLTRRREGPERRRELGASFGSSVPEPSPDSPTDSVARASEFLPSS